MNQFFKKGFRLETKSLNAINEAYYESDNSQTHAAKDAPDFNRGRNWRTAWGK